MCSNENKAARVKYSNWCERRPLAASRERIDAASKHLQEGDLTNIEKNVLFIHDLVDCQGLEFVVFSSAKLTERVTLPGKITLVPCFYPTIQGKSWNDPLVRLSDSMMRRARFVYDGWIPIDDWNIENVRTSIKKINQILTLFSIQERVSTTWEPKYMIHQVYPSSHNIENQHIQEIVTIHETLQNWKSDDSWAFYRSLGWLSQSLTLPPSPSRFLLCFVTIESLANFIENIAENDSIFSIIKATTKMDTTESDRCIEDILNHLYDKDKINAIKSSFFDCVHLSTRKMLESHLNNVFKENKKYINLLFKDRIEGKTLYDLRHMIAHGGLDTLSDVQIQHIKDRIWNIEDTARNYLVTILTQIIGKDPFPEKMIKAMVMPFSISAKEKQYVGPTHMAELYIY